MLPNITAARIANADPQLGCTLYPSPPQIFSQSTKISANSFQCFQLTNNYLILGKDIKITAKWYNTKTSAFEKEDTKGGAIGVSMECTSSSTLDTCKSDYEIYVKVENTKNEDQDVYFFKARSSFDYTADGVKYTDRQYYSTIRDYKIPFYTTLTIENGKKTKEGITKLNYVVPSGVKYTISWEDNEGRIKWNAFLGVVEGYSDDKSGSHSFDNGPNYIYPTYTTEPKNDDDYKYSADFKITADDNDFPKFIGYIKNENRVLDPYTLTLPGGLPVWAWIVIAIAIVLVVVIIIISICCCCCKKCRKCCKKCCKKSSSSSSS